jgi:hypothetical protein
MSDFAKMLWLVLQILFPDSSAQAPNPNTKTALPTPVIECKIDLAESGGRKTIVALASAAGGPQLVDYVLDVEAKGANTSRSRQRGTAKLTSGEFEQLATAKMSVGDGDVLSGRLSLGWNGGVKTCLLQ